MRVKTLVLGIVILIAASTLAMAADSGNGNKNMGPPGGDDPDVPDDNPQEPKIIIANNTVNFNFFNPNNTDTWEINVSWVQGSDHTEYESGPYYGTIYYNTTGTKSYMVVFFTNKTVQPEASNSAIIELPHYGQLVYDIDIKTYEEDGTSILNMTGTLDLTSLELIK